ncbi:hypothetical protein [Salinimicrobium oceani]|uniref:hypothetical protein n=1 Tax=Salinimicrobium oceani TaxID=2722702 RepID=UPI001ADD787A|nr:hypothetical protein [Salinimicrobium oceani]
MVLLKVTAPEGRNIYRYGQTPARKPNVHQSPGRAKYGPTQQGLHICLGIPFMLKKIDLSKMSFFERSCCSTAIQLL